ncbi:MAG: tripartite tricarboxylate transporter TctB family protein [Spirochaetia bacterium]|jgi:hypothetical protein|nr:tripartite tricarboxylate transporter TctB family protein [Spirochaetia bacterium]
MKSDIGSGFFFLVLSIVIWIAIPFQIQSTSQEMLNGQFFPRIVSIIMFTGSILQIVSTLRERHRNQSADNKLDFSDGKKVAILLGIIIAYLILMTNFGFLVPSLIIGAAILLFFKQKKPVYYLSVELAVVAIFFVFKYLLNVQLP